MRFYKSTEPPPNAAPSWEQLNGLTVSAAKKLAKKSGSPVLPSVNTILDAMMRDPHFEEYQAKTLMELARRSPNATYEELGPWLYGSRVHPLTGKNVPSGELGTEIHAAMESAWLFGLNDSEEYPLANFVFNAYQFYYGKGYRAELVEAQVGCPRAKAAGTIDCVLRSPEGDTLLIVDWKTRNLPPSGYAPWKRRDVTQLAAYGLILRNYPEILKGIRKIDFESVFLSPSQPGAWIRKTYSAKQVARGEQEFCLASHAFSELNQLGNG